MATPTAFPARFQNAAADSNVEPGHQSGDTHTQARCPRAHARTTRAPPLPPPSPRIPRSCPSLGTLSGLRGRVSRIAHARTRAPRRSGAQLQPRLLPRARHGFARIFAVRLRDGGAEFAKNGCSVCVCSFRLKEQFCHTSSIRSTQVTS